MNGNKRPTLTMLAAGYCTERETMLVQNGANKNVPVWAMCALLQHPTAGNILIDTGYAPRFLAATAHFPDSLYARLTPTTVSEQDSVVHQLAVRGIAPDDVQTILLTHLHADHLGGLRDFPQATFVYDRRAYTAVRDLPHLWQLRYAFLPALLPDDFEARSRPWGAHAWRLFDLAPFHVGVDVLGDGSVMALDLLGHAAGQVGFLIESSNHGRVLIAADACWYSATYRDLRWPHPLTRLFQHDNPAYRRTVHKLHDLHQRQPNLPILPLHCPEVYAHYVAA